MNAPIEIIRIGTVATSVERLKAIQELIRQQERAGWYDVIRMDDEVAVVQYRDPKIMMLFCETAGAA